MKKIIKNKTILSLKTEDIKSIEEGVEVSKQLISILTNMNPRPYGLSANQIGINKNVCVVWMENSEPVILMNPTYIEKSKELVIYPEVCVSIPGKVVKTKRHINVKISTLNFMNDITFKPTNYPMLTGKKDNGLAECVCVQHLIDLLNGKLITDMSVRHATEVKKVVKIKPNDKVFIARGNESQYIKYKKAHDLLNVGWKIV